MNKFSSLFTASASVSDIAYGVLTIIRTLRLHLPNTRILFLSVLPRNGVANFDNIVAINSIIETYHDGQNVFYLDLFNDFASDVWGSKLSVFFILESLRQKQEKSFGDQVSYRNCSCLNEDFVSLTNKDI